MARIDPGASKYQSTFEALVQRVAAVPKEAAEQLEAARPKRRKTKRRLKAKK